MQEKISSMTMYILIAISAVLFVLGMMENVDPILYGSYIFFGIGLLVTIGGAIMGMMANPKGLKEMGIGIAGMVIVLAISYVLADGSDFEQYKEISEGLSLFSGMLLYAMYILFGASVLTVMYSWIHSLTR